MGTLCNIKCTLNNTGALSNKGNGLSDMRSALFNDYPIWNVIFGMAVL